ncbi:MAG: moleuclar chaperone Hap20 [Deltaproteobacteria bacterium]|nr:moleuclar chaperone Hap20 [Deltaproteobacteria bacterium]
MAEDKKVVPAEKPARELQRKESPFDEIEHMFDDFLNRRFLMPSLFPRLKRPDLAEVATSIDMFEEGNDLVVKAELPGIKKEDLNVDLKDNFITISGEKKSEERTDRVDFHRVERSFGTFVRRLRLPVEIKADKVKASFSDGVLEIRMPKSEAVKQNVRKIKVT